MKKLNLALIGVLVFYGLAMCIGLQSCFSIKKADSQLDHIGRIYPGELAGKCQVSYPARITGSDTIRRTDSIPYFIQCPGNEADLAEFSAEDYAGPETRGAVIDLSRPFVKKLPEYKVPADTSGAKIRGVYVKIPVITTTVSNTSEDSAKIVILLAGAQKLTKENSSLHTWMVVGFSLAGSFLLVIILLGWLYYKLLKTKAP